MLSGCGFVPERRPGTPDRAAACEALPSILGCWAKVFGLAALGEMPHLFAETCRRCLHRRCRLLPRRPELAVA